MIKKVVKKKGMNDLEVKLRFFKVDPFLFKKHITAVNYGCNVRP
jgi:hypothetical protein